ncbi:MAG: Holliday junction branch migration protein RuvA [bacterium]|jgi:Holliday junction DNA helicase RuvA|nr:Holliday junction branch migration protein RuvA [bacterium]
MYEYLRGRVEQLTPTQVVLEAGGVGWDLACSLNTSRRLERGAEARLWVHLLVREDLLALVAFHSKGERELFRDLISVAGVGPKVALAVLSGLEEQDLLEVVRSGQVERLTRVPGIGRKIAERLLLELKDRFEKRHGPAGAGGIVALPASPAGADEPRRQALEALLALGFKPAPAELELGKALARWQSGGGEGEPAVEAWLRLVLQK